MQAHGAELANSLVTDLACLPMDMNEEITVVLYEMFQFSAQVCVWESVSLHQGRCG